MGSTTECSYCQGLGAGAASRCHHCGTWIRKQDYYSANPPDRVERRAHTTAGS